MLALREIADRSYDEIGEIMGISENAAAQLIFRARGKLKQELAAGAVASVVVATDDCEHARLLINRLEDGELVSDEEQEWLDDHLEHCGKCRAARGVLLDVGASYRAWAVVPVIAALRPEILTRAGEAIGLDWSGVAASTPVWSGGGTGAGGSGSGQSGSGGSGAGDGGAASGTAATGNGGAGGATGAANGASAGAAGARGLARPRGHHAVAQGALGAAVLAVTGIVAAGILHDDPPVTREAAPAEQVRPAEEPNEPPAASAAKAKSSVKQPAGINGSQPGAPAGAPAEPDLSSGPSGVPDGQGIGSPRDERGSSPNGGGPKTGTPGPGGGGPGNAPGGGGPGNQPGGGPGSGPGGNGPGGGPGGGAPGGGPGNPPGGTPGGGQTDPPGQPTDPGDNQPPPQPPPAGGGDCTFPGHGNGPGGCPPGHGGTPPGHGGTPPGQDKKPK